MTPIEFLQLLVPADGWLFTATQASGKGWINTAHKDFASASAHVAKLTADKRNAYFALASYREARVWDALLVARDGTQGRWRTRIQSNTKSLKCFWLDLDVEAGNEKKFDSKEDALAELIGFVRVVGLPRPMVVDSGGGLHVYWPLREAVPSSEWKDVATKLKAITAALEFKTDHSLTSDEARVLRALGGYNFRRDAPVQLLSPVKETYEFAEIKRVVDAYCTTFDVTGGPAHRTTPAPQGLPGAAPAALEADNLGATNDPLHFDRIAFACAQIGAQAAVRGAGIGEKLWHAGIGIVKFCEPQWPAALAISDGHAEFTAQATQEKIINWRAGPTTCEKFHLENRATCEACPHWGQLTSPAQLGRAIHEAAAPVVVAVDDLGNTGTVAIPEPPRPYKRRKTGGIVIESEDEEGQIVYVSICPYDLYPIKIMRQYGDDAQVEERSVWRAHLPRLGPTDMELPQALLSDTRKLYAYLLSKGVHMSPDESKATQVYMSAYLQTLANATDREKLYERLGWHDNRNAFVLGKRVLHRDGTSSPHNPGKTVRAVTKDGVTTAGTLDGWRAAMRFYNAPGYEGHRMFLYAALAAPIFHMTGHKGVLMTAAGSSGRGKTTCLMSCASIWGDPEHLILNGNKDGATTNALYEHLGTYHSLPFLLDDTTERDPEEIRRMMLNLSQGMGKERMKGSEHSGHSVKWETIVQSTANTDDISRIMALSKDVEPHLMRFISVEFGLVDTSAEAKITADAFIRTMKANYGHVGPSFLQAIMPRYDAVKALVERNIDMITRRVDAVNSSAERLWVACIASAYTAAQIAQQLGLIDFPFESDLAWMINHLGEQRESIKETRSSAQDLLSAFLEKHFGHALILSAKQASTLDNVSHRPLGSLYIRHELDVGLMYVARSAILEYCGEVRIPMKGFEKTLMSEGIVLQRNVQKVLGADTIFAKGQTRCWRIDATKLAGTLTLAEQAIAQQRIDDAIAKRKSNVVPIVAGARA